MWGGAARGGTGRREGVGGPGGAGGGKSPKGSSPQPVSRPIYRATTEYGAGDRVPDGQRRRAGCVAVASGMTARGQEPRLV